MTCRREAAGPVKEIRAWLENKPEGDLRDLYAEFGGEKMRETLKALDYLENRKEMTVADHLYRYGRKHGLEAKESRQTAIFRSMRYLAKARQCMVVPLNDICETAPAEESYARRYLKFLEGLGLIRIRKNQDGETHIAVFPKTFELIATPHYNQRRERRNAREAAQ